MQTLMNGFGHELSMAELELVAGGFNWGNVDFGKAAAIGLTTGATAGAAGLVGGPKVAGAAALGGFVGGFGSTVINDGWEK
ncbi:hypothetical protein [Neisseria sp.]|uniref:hypothetical protein n=1 Tax=Neisseria sp. TaxID=192066 RepID=UPI0026DBD7DE|nr:hypothetical protein [Neisseria sp.]MDO4908126.1 hypothetical protein [Neisseria sp.]